MIFPQTLAAPGLQREEGGLLGKVEYAPAERGLRDKISALSKTLLPELATGRGVYCQKPILYLDIERVLVGRQVERNLAVQRIKPDELSRICPQRVQPVLARRELANKIDDVVENNRGRHVNTVATGFPFPENPAIAGAHGIHAHRKPRARRLGSHLPDRHIENAGDQPGLRDLYIAQVL